ncbi:MAG: hypothetical protein AB7K52_02635 [Phycisphaerales bacterium]
MLAGVSLLMVVALAMTTGGLAEFLPALAVTGARVAAEATPVRVIGEERREAERIRPSGLGAAEAAGGAAAESMVAERQGDEGREARGSRRVRVALLSLPPPMPGA